MLAVPCRQSKQQLLSDEELTCNCCCLIFLHQVQHSEKTPLLSVLLEGPDGSGKTALAAHAAIQSEFPFAKVTLQNELATAAFPFNHIILSPQRGSVASTCVAS